jgi:RPA family protein
VITLSGDGEKEYIRMVAETARSMWGEETVKQFMDHIERTAKAVYEVGSYPLEASAEPVTKLRPEAA